MVQVWIRWEWWSIEKGFGSLEIEDWEGRIDARRLSETRQGEGGRSSGAAYLYKDKDIRHSSIEITIHRRCIPMWKARWTLNPQQSEREEDLSGIDLENALYGLSHPPLDSFISPWS